MKSLTLVPILAGYCKKNFFHNLNDRDLLQEFVEMTIRIHNSNKSWCFLIALALGICCILLVKEIKEAYRRLVRMRTIKLCQTPYHVELGFEE